MNFWTIQQSPWLAIANKQLELLHKFMTELGLSPVSRSRVEVKSLQSKPCGDDAPRLLQNGGDGAAQLNL